MLFASASGASSSNSGNFLIPNGTFVVELVIFLVVLGVVAKWILPPLQNVSEARRVRIRTALEEAEQARAEAHGLFVEARPGPCRGENRGARRSSTTPTKVPIWPPSRDAPRARWNTSASSRRQDSEIAAESDQARQELLSRLEPLVVSAAERVLGGEVELSSHSDLIYEAVSAATRAGAVGGAS